MSFVFALQIVFPDAISFENSSERFLELEENFLKNFSNREYDISENGIMLYNPDFIDSCDISFKDYVEEGKFLKNFFIKNDFMNEGNYKDFFKMKKIEFQNNFQNNELDYMKKLDSMIAVVDKNDPKLLEILGKIEKIKNK